MANATTGKTAGPTAALASVAFLKMHEFARRPVTEQARLRAQLEAVVAVTSAELEPASRVLLDAADGVAVVVLDDPIGALRLAERALSAAAAGLPLSVGINHGAVQLAGAGKGDEGLAGDGIAVAANVAEFAAPSTLLISRSFRDASAVSSRRVSSPRSFWSARAWARASRPKGRTSSSTAWPPSTATPPRRAEGMCRT